MRTLTLARMGRALMIAAAMIMLPQLASAQLPVTTKQLTLQDDDASAGVSFKAAGTTTAYTLTMPATLPALAGALLYTSTTDGGLSWTDPTGIGNGYYPRWDAGTSTIVWTNPSGADNPNWSLTGNALTSDGFRVLGFPAGSADISIETNGARRIGITDGGAIDLTGTVGITGATTIVGATDINATGTAATRLGVAGGDVTIGGTDGGGTPTISDIAIGVTGSTITSTGSLGHTGTSSFTGAVTLAGANSPLVANTGAGTAGDVLVSAGATDTPTWTSLADATGIRARGSVSLTAGDVDEVVTGLTGVLDSDIVIVTLQGTTSAVIGVVTAQAAGGFTVTFSSAIPTGGTPKLNYIVMKP